MMIRVARLYPLLTVIFGLILALVLLVVHSAPLTVSDTDLAWCGAPCWAGIVPGQTSFADSADLLTARFPDAELTPSPDRFGFVVPSSDLVGTFTADQGRVHQFFVSASQPLWTALLTLGAPRCIQYTDRQLLPEMIMFYWQFDDTHVMTNVDFTHSDPAALTRGVQLWRSPPDSPCATSDNTLPWPGFLALK